MQKLKNLWYFWDGDPMPPICRLGVKSLLLHAEGFDVHELNCNNIHEFLPNLRKEWNKIKKWAHKADYIRPRILHEYGGIFVDVDVICLEDLSILTDALENSEATLMADEMSCTDKKWLAVGLLVAKPNSPVLKKYSNLQDDCLEKRNFKVGKWHTIGGNLLNDCNMPEQIYPIKYQRAFPVSQTNEYLTKEHWTKFVRHCRGIPKPVIWPICYSSHFDNNSTKHLTENDWLKSEYMISSAFRYALRHKKIF